MAGQTGYTQEQQNQLNVLQNAVTNSTGAYNAAVQAYANAVAAQEACQAERDKYSLPTKKNQACHIDTLNQLSSQTASAAEDRNAKEIIMNNAKAALQKYIDDLRAQAETAAAFNAATLAGDAGYQLQSQQNAITAQNNAAQLALTQSTIASQLQQQKTADEEAAKRKKLIITVSIVAGSLIVLTVVSIIVYKKFFSEKKEG